MDSLLNPQIWLSLLTLTALEIILGIDNLVFISIVCDNLPAQQQRKARRTGLFLAVISRLGLLIGALWIIKLTQPLFTLYHQAFSIRDLFLIAGGLFLLVKGTNEIHAGFAKIEEQPGPKVHRYGRFFAVVMQIMVLDIVFSFDSVITAVGLTDNFKIMSVAIIIAVLVMLLASDPMSYIINKYPSIKVLALSFLVMIGMVLIADGFKFHIPRGYLYFAMAFSIIVEILNIAMGQRSRGSGD